MLDRHSRYLIVQFALKDFKTRYTHSFLGYAWSVVNPLIFTLLYFLVFSSFMRFNVRNYPCYLLLGIAFWSFFSEGSANGVSALLGRANIISKVAMPRHVVVLAAVLNALITFVITLGIFGGLLWWSKVDVGWPVVVLPWLLADLVLMTLAVGLLLSPLHVRFHDVGYLWGIALQILFWLTPIIYHETAIPEQWRWIITYNPMARLVLYSRQVVIYAQWPDFYGLTKTTIAILAFLALGWTSFGRLQARVAEYL